MRLLQVSGNFSDCEKLGARILTVVEILAARSGWSHDWWLTQILATSYAVGSSQKHEVCTDRPHRKAH